MKTDVVTLSKTGEGRKEALEQAENAAALAGLTGKNALHIRLLAEEMLGVVLRESKKPLVIDADAISLLKEYKTELSENENRSIIITPHVMEMARFLEVDKGIVLDDLIHVAKSTSDKYRLICVLKDARTIITKPGKGCCSVFDEYARTGRKRNGRYAVWDHPGTSCTENGGL